jgi:ketosteroid isomerase-like protein
MTNVDRLRPAYKAWDDTRAADPSVWLDLFAEEVDMRSLADGAPGMEFTSNRKGLAQAREFFAGVAREWEMISFSADDFISEGDRVVMIGRCSWRHKGTGKAVESPILHVWRFRDGKAVELFECFDTARAVAATQPG